MYKWQDLGEKEETCKEPISVLTTVGEYRTREGSTGPPILPLPYGQRLPHGLGERA